MSIPGLGQILVQPAASSTRTIILQPFWEWRFEAPPVANPSSSVGGVTSSSAGKTNARHNHPAGSSTSSSTNTGSGSASTGPSPLTVRLVSGTAERDGTELAQGVSYVFAGAKSKILTWHGCSLEVSGQCDDYVAEHSAPDETPAVSYLNLHFALQSVRSAAYYSPSIFGPRVLVCGPPSAGKSTLARTLVALATRHGRGIPVAASLDPSEGLLSLPGTVSAAAFASPMDLQTTGGGVGVAATPTSGPAAVPIKLPIVYYYGRERAEDDPPVWEEVVGRLAGTVRARMANDDDIRIGGVVIDTPAVSVGKSGVDLLMSAISAFDVTVVVVLGSARLNAELHRKLAQQKTSRGEDVAVVMLDKSEGVVERDEAFMQQVREASVKEYFFGDAQRTLSPFTQQVDFHAVTIYKIPDLSEYLADEEVLEKVDPAPDMTHWTFAVMNASVNDPIETIRYASVRGFVYVGDVDPDRRRLKVLAPLSGRLGDRPLMWGRWPEPHINLLG